MKNALPSSHIAKKRAAIEAKNRFHTGGEESKEQHVVKGAMILLAATGLVKLIGALFKIPLTNLLGGEGMGYFSTAYGLFNPMYAVSVAGFPVALSKLVSQYRAEGRISDLHRTYRLSWILFSVVGILGTAAIYFLAGPFCSFTGNPQAFWSVRMIAPALLFGCMMSVYRGYYQGMGNMNPTAFSQLAEALTKLLCGIGAVLVVRQIGMEQFSHTGTVFGLPASSYQEAQELLAPFCSAGAVAGVSISTLAGTLFLICYHLFTGRRGRYRVRPQQPPRSYRNLGRSLAEIAVPVCLGAVAVNLTGVVDLFTVMNGLERAISTAPQQVLEHLPAICAQTANAEMLPNFLYGSYQGLAVNLYTLLPAITASFGVSSLPSISGSFAKGDAAAVCRQVNMVLNMTLLFALPAGLGLSVLSEPILTLLYPGRGAEVAVAAPLLSQLGVAAIFVAVSMPVNSMLQAIGKAKLPVKLMLWGAGFKLALNLLLIPNPALHINGAPWGSLACYLLLAVAGLRVLFQTTGARPQWKKWGKLLAASLGCAGCAKGGYWLLSGVCSPSFSTVVSILIAAGVYLCLLQLFGMFSQKELGRFLFKGKNPKKT